jgi:uncharacterized protein
VIRGVIVDAGPITAFLDAGDGWHPWALARFQEMEAPLLTVEPVLAEVSFLLRRNPAAQDDLLRMVAKGALRIPFRLEGEVEAVRLLRAKYQDLPMSLADACLVRLAELLDDHRVCTLDSDFTIYRKHGKTPIPLITPL